MPAVLRTTYPTYLLCLKRHCMYAPRSQTHQVGSKKDLPLVCLDEGKENQPAGSSPYTLVPTFDDVLLAHDEVKAAACYCRVRCKRPRYGANGEGPPALLRQRLFPLPVTNILHVCVDAAGYTSSHSERVDVIQGQQAAWLPHIQHGRTSVLGDEQLAVLWSPYWSCIRATVLPSPKWVSGDVLAMGYTRHPPRFPPAGRCLRRRRGNG